MRLNWHFFEETVSEYELVLHTPIRSLDFYLSNTSIFSKGNSMFVTSDQFIFRLKFALTKTVTYSDVYGISLVLLYLHLDLNMSISLLFVS